jgi:hypothetical protein
VPVSMRIDVAVRYGDVARPHQALLDSYRIFQIPVPQECSLFGLGGGVRNTKK